VPEVLLASWRLITESAGHSPPCFSTLTATGPPSLNRTVPGPSSQKTVDELACIVRLATLALEHVGTRRLARSARARAWLPEVSRLESESDQTVQAGDDCVEIDDLHRGSGASTESRDRDLV
jgi:hypothetical protein